MFIQKSSIIFRFVAWGFVGAAVTCVFAQEPGELLLPEKNNFGVEAIAPEIVTLPEASDQDFETLTRGPLHEAFAELIVSDPSPGLVVSPEPPAPINELAPEFRPEDEDAIWIAGYWGWDEQREDFIWISGVFRVPPDGHQWVPGYWHQVKNGWQWVQGFWIEDVAESIAYLPPPPKTLENGPSSLSPGVNYFYIPGNWSQAPTSSYQWTAGYWHPLQEDLIWIPSQVVWTPSGCVFVNGYWDRRLPMRGICFAPVSIPRSTYSRPGWSLRPNVVLDSQVVLHNLFVQPRYNHYVFGDYYGLPAGQRSVVPAYVYHQSRGSSDPLVSFYAAYNARQGQDMIRWYGNQYADLSRHPSKRPPQIWSPTISVNESGTKQIHIAHSLDQFNGLEGVPKLSPLTAGLQQETLKRDLDRKQFSQERKAMEQKGNIPNALTNGIANGVVNSMVNPPTLALPKLEPIVRRSEGPAKIGNMPLPPRNTGRTQANGDMQRNNDRNLRPANPSQGLRRVDPIPNIPVPNIPVPNIVESKKLGLPNSSNANRIGNPTEGNRSPDRLKPLGLDQIGTPKNQSPLSNAPFPLPNGATPRTNVKPKLPSFESRPPNVQLPQQGRMQPSKEDRQKTIPGLRPMGGPLGQIRNGLPGQSGGPPSSPNIKLPDNNALSTRSIPTLDLQRPDRQPRQGNPPPNRRGGSEKVDGGKKPN